MKFAHDYATEYLVHKPKGNYLSGKTLIFQYKFDSNRIYKKLNLASPLAPG